MVQQSLITHEARSYIGKESKPITDVVEKNAVRRYCLASGDLNPLYLDEEYAKSHRYGALIAPPIFFTCLGHYQWGSDLEIGPDGLPTEPETTRVPLPLKRVLAGGTEWEFFEPVKAGDTITFSDKILDIYEREGRSGHLIMVMTETTYKNQHDRIVAKSLSTNIHR